MIEYNKSNMILHIGQKIKVSHRDNPQWWCIGTIENISSMNETIRLSYTCEESLKSMLEGYTLIVGHFYPKWYSVEIL